MKLVKALKQCFAEGCDARVPSTLLMCKKHWRLVPAEIQGQVWNTLRAWQSGGSPKAYIAAIKRARISLNAKKEEGL